MAHFITSTLTAPQDYTAYDGNNVVNVVKINGGNSLVNRNLVTLDGAVTEVSADELASLKDNFLFNLHIKNGFIKVSSREAIADKAVSELEARDEASPLTQNDIDSMQNDRKTGVDVDFDDPDNKKQRRGKAK